MRILLALSILLITLPLNAQTLSDPTRPANWGHMLTEDEVVEQQYQPLQEVQAVFFSPRGNSVMVDDHRYFKGDVLGNKKIQRITAKSIVLVSPDGDRSELTMTLPSVKQRSGALQGLLK